MLIILKSLNILSITMFLLSLHSLVVRIPNGQRFTSLLWALENWAVSTLLEAERRTGQEKTF